MDNYRRIIHVDMDAFFASVEQRDSPDLRGKPVVVGGPPGTRSVVCTCSYEARKFGIHSAMPSNTAVRLCPAAVFITPDIQKYSAVSKIIQRIFKEYTDSVEPVSLDEAYLDVTGTFKSWGSATEMAKAIKNQIYTETQLTASAGVSFNKFLAKTASDMNKPDGLTVITPAKAFPLLMEMPVERFHGIGKKTSARLKEKGIRLGKDLYGMPLYLLMELFGKSGEFYYNIVRGQDDRPVVSSWKRKSYGRETTLSSDITDLALIKEILENQIAEICGYLRMNNILASNLIIKVKYFNFRENTRSIKLPSPTNQEKEIIPLCFLLLERTDCGKIPVRLLGASIQISENSYEDSKPPAQQEFLFSN